MLRHLFDEGFFFSPTIINVCQWASICEIWLFVSVPVRDWIFSYKRAFISMLLAYPLINVERDLPESSRKTRSDISGTDWTIKNFKSIINEMQMLRISLLEYSRSALLRSRARLYLSDLPIGVRRRCVRWISLTCFSKWTNNKGGRRI